MTKINGFGYLGASFQLKLLSQIIVDNKFGEQILNIINPKYFDNVNYRQIMVFIKDYYEKYESLPNFENLQQIVSIEIKDEIQVEYLSSLIKDIQSQTLEDSLFIQDKALKFCKQQEVTKAVKKITTIIEKGDFENYELCNDILRKALDVGEESEEGIEVLSGL